MHSAADKHDITIVKYLVEKGANINARTTNTYGNKTPLFITLESGYYDISEYLIEMGALIDLQVLALRPNIIIPYIHKQMKMEDKWASALMLIIREQDNYSAEKFKAYVLEFLDKTKTDVPDNIRIILNTLI